MREVGKLRVAEACLQCVVRPTCFGNVRFDGTLADSCPLFRAVFNDLARTHGFNTVQPEEVPALRRCRARPWGYGDFDVLRTLAPEEEFARVADIRRLVW